MSATRVRPPSGRQPPTSAARRGLDPFLTGVLIILAVAAVAYLAFHRGLPFQHGFRINAIVASSNQLRAGSPVRIAGVNVGEVKGISAGPGQTTKVTMQIADQGQPIHTDATLRIRPRVFLEGGFYVELHPGTPGGPVLGDGGTIPLPQTAVPVQVSQVLSVFQAPTRESLRNILYRFSAAFAHGGASALRRAAPLFAPTLRDVARATRAAQGTQPHDVSNLIVSGSRVAGVLANNQAALAGLVRNLDLTATALAASDGALGASVREVDAVLRASPAPLAALDAALPPLRRFGMALDPGLRVAPRVLDDVSRSLRQLGALVAPAARSRLITALQSALRDLPTLIDRVGELFPVGKPITDCLLTHGLPLLTSQVPDGALSSGRPVWQDFAHGLVGLAGASQNFDGNGYALRYLGGGGAQSLSTGPLPVIGTLAGSSPSSARILGARPTWLGPGVVPPFRPDQPCTAQPLPNLQASTAPPDLTPAGPAETRTGAARQLTAAGAGALTLRSFEHLLAHAARQGGSR